MKTEDCGVVDNMPFVSAATQRTEHFFPQIIYTVHREEFEMIEEAAKHHTLPSGYR